MKLRNKKTGEIKNVNHSKVLIHFNDGETKCVKSLAELNEEWEDYEEPKCWYVNMYGDIDNITKGVEDLIPYLKEVGNYFGTKEEAEKAVEKLKAWKRLKDARFEFTDYHYKLEEDDALITYRLNIEGNGFAYEDLTDDLRLLFGGEE